MKKSVDNGDFALFVDKVKYKCSHCSYEFKNPKKKRVYGFRAEEEYGPFGEEAEFDDVCPKCNKVVTEYPVDRARSLWNKEHPNDRV